MRKFLLLSLLAATAATPAFAQEQGERRGNDSEPTSISRHSGSHGNDRSDRGSNRRSDDSPSASQGDSRPQPRDAGPPRDRSGNSGLQSGGLFGGAFGNDNDGARRNQGAGDTVRNWRRGSSDQGVGNADSTDTVRNWRGRDRRPDSPAEIQDRNLRAAPADTVVDRRTIEERNLRRAGDGSFDRNVRTTPGFGGRRVGRIGNNVPVEGTAPPPVTTEQARRGTTSHRWSGDWRRDNRYDWRRYRDHNRSRFHFGFYFDPFGWSYRRYNIGWRLWPSYYGQDYWLNDPWQYRLPPAYGPYRWVRYYDDALLVNIYTGTVVDVIYNFFW